MSAAKLSPHLALRIGLAARAMPDAGLAQLMRVLVELLGLPLTEEKLARVNVGNLRAASAGLLAGIPRAELRQALGYLHGRTPVSIIEETPPLLAPYTDGEMPDSLRLAVASDQGERIDGNFSSCAAFLIYQVSAREIRLIDRRPAPAGDRKSGRDALRSRLIDDCHLFYGRSLSNACAARLMTAGIHPVCFPEGGAAREKLAALQRVLQGHPPPWLARAMGSGLPLPSRPGMRCPLLVYSQ